MLKGERQSAYELRVVSKKGDTKWILQTVTSIQYQGKSAILGNFIDITEHKQIEVMMEESEERYRILTENSLVGVYLIQNNLFQYVNPAFAHIYGYEREEITGKIGPLDLVIPEDHAKVMEKMQRKPGDDNQNMLFELRMRRKDGAIRIVEVYGSRAIFNGRPAVLGTLLDVTEKKQLEEQLQAMSLVDELTKLYNRRGFFTIAEQQVLIASRTMKEMLFFFIDLDRMKWINDNLGHKEGDDALIRTSAILKDTFREADVIGRIGGDEFAVLAVGTNDMSAEVLKKRLLEKIEAYNAQGDSKYQLSFSIGVAIYNPERPSSIDELMAVADELMYEEKRNKYSRE